MYTLDGIDSQFTSKWDGSDIVKENFMFEVLKSDLLPCVRKTSILPAKMFTYSKTFGWLIIDYYYSPPVCLECFFL